MSDNQIVENSTAATEPTSRKLQFFPINVFTAIMGLGGLTLAYISIHEIFGLSQQVYISLGWLTLIAFLAATATYSVKIIKHWQAFKTELKNPMALPFFPSFSISILLMSQLFAPYLTEFAAILWYLGASLQLVLTFYILNQWIHAENWQMPQLTPVWFLPVVGNIIAAIGATQFAGSITAIFFFSIGFIFWLVLKTLITYRLTFHVSLPDMLKPTLFIFIAPPALAFTAYIHIAQTVDIFALVIYFISLFMTMLLITQVRHFMKLKFAISWWAFIFPIATITNASFNLYKFTELQWAATLGVVLLAVLTLATIYVAAKTLLMVKNKQLCQQPVMPKPAATEATEK